MKNNKLQLMLAGLFLCAAAMPALAQEKTREEKKLESSAVELDKSAAKPEGQVRVSDKIKAEFGVDDARIQSLRDKNMGYGGISIALALAQSLPGGITDANVDKVMAMRQGPPVMGWGKIAKELDLKLGSVQSKVHKMSAEVKKADKAEGRKEMKEMKGERGGKPEKMARPETRGKSGSR